MENPNEQGMEFEDRSETSSVLVDVIERHFWSKSQLLYHVETGYETHIDKEIREALRYVRNKTARHLRFTPDFLIVERKNPENIYYLEYKCTRTPLYSPNRIKQIGERAGIELLDQNDIKQYRLNLGQCELDAYDNYVALSEIGVRVAILNYVAYHHRLLLCDFIENIKELRRDKVTTATISGSRTPYVNFDVNPMKTLDNFLVEIHGVNHDTVTSYYNDACAELKASLPKYEHKNSPWR